MTTTTNSANATVKVRAVVLDDSLVPVGMGLESEVLLSDFFANGAPATTAAAGVVKQAAFIAQVTPPFADLTAAATAYNSLLTALKNAGVIKPTA